MISRPRNLILASTLVTTTVAAAALYHTNQTADLGPDLIEPDCVLYSVDHFPTEPAQIEPDRAEDQQVYPEQQAQVDSSNDPYPITVESWPFHEQLHWSLAAQAPQQAKHLEGGVRMIRFKGGAWRECSVEREGKLQAHYTGWSGDGLLDSSRARQRAFVFERHQVIEGWRVALDHLCVGDQALVWIPAEKAYGAYKEGDKKSGDLVFEIELLLAQ